MDGDNLAGDFSLDETNTSSCCNIFDAISLDLEGTGVKVVPWTLLFALSFNGSPAKTGFSVEVSL
jgi:hypothetical protein